jgi:hypothetical protein
LKYSTYLMVGALTFDLLVAIVYLIVALGIGAPALASGFYAFLGALIFILIGMGASLGLTVGGYRRSMLAVSLVFNLALAALMFYFKAGLVPEAVTALVALVNIAASAMAYSAMGSGREVKLPILGV